MKENFDAAFQRLLQHEGTYSNHPQDRGGVTMYGVTQRVWEEWVGHTVDEKIMRGLTPDRVKHLYLSYYLFKVFCYYLLV